MLPSADQPRTLHGEKFSHILGENTFAHFEILRRLNSCRPRVQQAQSVACILHFRVSLLKFGFDRGENHGVHLQLPLCVEEGYSVEVSSREEREGEEVLSVACSKRRTMTRG